MSVGFPSVDLTNHRSKIFNFGEKYPRKFEKAKLEIAACWALCWIRENDVMCSRPCCSLCANAGHMQRLCHLRRDLSIFGLRNQWGFWKQSSLGAEGWLFTHIKQPLSSQRTVFIPVVGCFLHRQWVTTHGCHGDCVLDVTEVTVMAVGELKRRVW